MPHKDALLTEYQACYQAVLASGSRVWQSVSVVLGGIFAGVALLTRLENPDPLTRVLIMLIAAAGMAASIFRQMFVRREGWRVRVHYLRGRQIEEMFGLRAFWDIHVLDHWGEAGEKLSRCDQRDQDRYRDLHDKLPNPGPFGWKFIRWLVWLGLGLWTITLLTQLFVLLGWATYFGLVKPV